MSYERKVFLKDVDATGRIYFGVVFDYAIEAFQHALHENERTLKDLFSSGYGFPIVHAEANYASLLSVSDEVSVKVKVIAIGEKSFTLKAEIRNRATQKMAAEVTLVHAFVKQGEERASEVPEEMKDFLRKL
jgi:acyl-CoA thioesterase FadM